MDQKKAIKWISSEGGPLILLERNIASYWKGHDGSGTGERLSTDYERACEIEDYLGFLPVGPGEALVLNDEPMQTAWMRLGDTLGIVIRWEWAEDEETLVSAVQTIPEDLWEESGLSLNVRDGRLLLFD